MEPQIEQIVQAIGIAFDQSQASLHQEALAYIASIQENSNETWRLALQIFVDQNTDGARKYPPQARFFSLRVLDDFLDNKFERFDDEAFQTLQQALVNYIQSEYVVGPAEADATFIRNKFSHTLTLFFLCTYTEQWPSFFTDIFTLLRPSEQSKEKGFNQHISLLFFHIVLEISGEVADQIIKSARTFNTQRHGRDARVRDDVRERDAAQINQAVLTIVADRAERMGELRKNPGAATNPKELDHVVEVVDWGVRTFGSYVSWIDINLTVTPTTVPLLFNLLADSSLPIRLATALALTRIVLKGLKEPGDKLQLLKVLSLGQVLDALETKTREQQVERGGDTDEAEESYREALGKLLNGLGLEVMKLVEDSTSEEIRSEATIYLTQLQPVLLRFMADEYDDTCSTVFTLLSTILGQYKRARKSSAEPLDDTKRNFLTSLLQVILTKLKWDEDPDLDDADEDDITEFEKMRKDLRSFLDSVLTIDQELVTNAVRNLASQTIQAYTNGVPMKWNDAELGIYLIYIFGEVNKGGGKGRSAFCHTPVVDPTKRKGTDYSEFPLTPLGEMLDALVQSGISSFPNRAVSLQFFETASRYTDFFKVRKGCILPTLEAMVDRRGLHNENSQYRLRVYYLFHRFIKDLRNELPANVGPTIIDSVRDLLPIVAEIPEPEEPEMDILTEAIKNSTFDSQLYLFETVGTLCSLMFRSPQDQSALLLSLVKPLMDDLSINFQAFRANGASDLIPIVKVHHIIMALGNIAKGFPDYPNPLPENWALPPMEVFAEMGQAILVCLEAMNIFKPIRDATRFAFARILATAGPNVTRFIPPLMTNLLAHFEPSELADFMNFIGLLIHKLQRDMFDVLDQLIGPLNSHIGTMMSQPISGTDDQLAHVETKKAYVALLNNVMMAKLQGIFISERNASGFESLLQTMQQVAVDVTDPTTQKVAINFLSRCVSVWGQPVSESSASANGEQGLSSQGLPGFDRFIYERLVPAVFGVPSSPNFNVKDGQMMVVLQEIANLLQTVCKIRGDEAFTFLGDVFLPSQSWPPDMVVDFTTKLRLMDAKSFRKYFSDLIKSSRASS
ncbi:KapM protein [Crepidotus variabilis]|uniref:Exportin-T n=1 Tax=Crepidotus variabilis TaxID=179855 RepID=A0A9P6JUL8_9AGAR|nr:KapM protein [Crepidotus variabilis]